MVELNLSSWPKVAPSHAMKLDGSLLALVSSLGIREREEHLMGLLQGGFYPEFMRRLQAIDISTGKHQLKIWVTPDYLSLGTDADPYLLPLSFIHTAELVREWDCLLPTPKIVDLIYAAAPRKIWPKSYPPNPEMGSMRRILEHSRWIQGQKGLNLDPDRLTAGHKKDLVLSRRLEHRKQRLAIYGWQNLIMGEAIQPLSIWHHAEYVDYSHGIRLLGAYGLLDGEVVRLEQILRDPNLAHLLSDEGPLEPSLLLEPIPARTF